MHYLSLPKAVECFLLDDTGKVSMRGEIMALRIDRHEDKYLVSIEGEQGPLVWVRTDEVVTGKKFREMIKASLEKKA